MWKLKNNANDCTYKTETDSQTENKPTVTTEERQEGRGKSGVWGNRCSYYVYNG